MKILNINNGDVLSGELYVVVSPDENYRPPDHYEGELAVDGEVIQVTNVRPQGDGSRTMGFCLPTHHHANGPHVLRVTDRRGNKDTHQVQFANTIHAVYPGGLFDVNPDAEDIPHSARITAVVSPTQPWRVEITSISGTIVRSFSGNGDMIDVVWNGIDDQGDMAEDASYLLTFSTPTTSSKCMSFVNKVSM